MAIELSEYYNPSFVDFEDLKALGDAINKAREGLYKVTQEISVTERKLRTVEYKYSVAIRRAMASSTQKTATDRKIEAEIANEELELNVLKARVTFEQLKRVADLLRSELQTLQTISNNLRQQLKML